MRATLAREKRLAKGEGEKSGLQTIFEKFKRRNTQQATGNFQFPIFNLALPPRSREPIAALLATGREHEPALTKISL